MFLIRRRKRFQFTERKHSKKGIIASVLSAAVLVAYGVIVTQAFRTDEKNYVNKILDFIGEVCK